MSIIAKQRPGVYSDYQTSGILYSKKRGKSIAIVAKSSAEANKVYSIQKLSDAQTIFGNSSIMYSMCKTVFENGSSNILAISVGNSDKNYTSAFKVLEETDDINVAICDSTNVTIQQSLMQSVVAASLNKKERVGIVAADENLTELANWASSFNNERILLVAQNPINVNGNLLSGCILTAAVAAIISQYTDPSQSFNGTSFEGISKLNKTLTEDEVDEYINNGIIPFELVAGRVEIIRAVTSKTTTDGVSDKTFKEVNTILIIDEVIKSIREMLSKNISIAKNNITTRNAISSQVTVKLQEFLDANIIDAYATPNVYQSSDDPTVCIVEIDFTVAQGVNQIHITANINV
ncbi:uncharacterized protein BN706_00663 [Clostridium sp. CAG:557]|nr:uncharacterized protein BN706_00663 [Clostridium sp. CAG:557]